MNQPLYSNLGFHQPLEVRHGSTFLIEVRITDADGAPFDLTGCEVRAAIARLDGSDKVDFVFAAPADPTLGIAQGELSPVSTASLVANDRRMSVPAYRWACDIKLASGQILPYCHGEVAVRSSIVNWS